jgi:hypothetical protein
LSARLRLLDKNVIAKTEPLKHLAPRLRNLLTHVRQPFYCPYNCMKKRTLTARIDVQGE